jgi:Raf kinase inhibitor-like YbhB/YbcL family protein
MRRLGAGLVLVAMVAGCARSTSEGSRTPSESSVMSLTVTSAAFANGQEIPARHTCQGDDVSPPLTWSGTPPRAKAQALIVEDPDAPNGNWVHWVVFDLAPTLRALPEGVRRDPSALDGAKVGTNDFKEARYGGPCPPPGKAHRYFFRVFALDDTLGLAAGATRDEVMHAMEGHVLARGELMGTYARR